jgi:hypothetical protein
LTTVQTLSVAYSDTRPCCIATSDRSCSRARDNDLRPFDLDGESHQRSNGERYAACHLQAPRFLARGPSRLQLFNAARSAIRPLNELSLSSSPSAPLLSSWTVSLATLVVLVWSPLAVAAAVAVLLSLTDSQCTPLSFDTIHPLNCSLDILQAVHIDENVVMVARFFGLVWVWRNELAYGSNFETSFCEQLPDSALASSLRFDARQTTDIEPKTLRLGILVVLRLIGSIPAVVCW